MQLVTGDQLQGLSEIPATLLIPLAFRAQESRSPNPIIRDPHAVALIDKINFDFNRFERGLGNRMSRFGVATRTLLFDNAVKRFLADYPNGCVLNVGCGLDARFYRVDNGLITWIDVDVAESLELRRVFFEESERHRMLRGSVLERSWLADLPSDLPTLILCEGTFMYFQELEVKSFVNDLIESLPIRRLCFEVAGPWIQDRVHPSIKQLGLDLRLTWGTRDFESIRRWHRRITSCSATSVFDVCRDRMPWVARLLTAVYPRSRTGIGSSIVELDVDPAAN